jgi:hypothetical protein
MQGSDAGVAGAEAVRVRVVRPGRRGASGTPAAVRFVTPPDRARLEPRHVRYRRWSRCRHRRGTARTGLGSHHQCHPQRLHRGFLRSTGLPLKLDLVRRICLSSAVSPPEIRREPGGTSRFGRRPTIARSVPIERGGPVFEASVSHSTFAADRLSAAESASCIPGKTGVFRTTPTVCQLA